MSLPVQHSKRNATKRDTESAIFAHVMNELIDTNGFLDTTEMLLDMLDNKMDIS